MLANNVYRLSQKTLLNLLSEKNRIYTPSGFKLDYRQIKKLVGTGKIYVRLYREEKVNSTDDDSDYLSLPPAPGFTTRSLINNSLSVGAQSTDQPCCSSRSTPTTNTVTLQEILPDVPANALDNLFRSQNINEATNSLADNVHGTRNTKDKQQNKTTVGNR